MRRNERARGLQAHVILRLDGLHLIPKRPHDTQELSDAFGIRAAGFGDVKGAPDPEDIARIQGGGFDDALKRPMLAQRLNDRFYCGEPRRGIGPRDNHDLRQGDGGVTDEHAVRRVGARWDILQIQPKILQHFAESLVLLGGDAILGRRQRRARRVVPFTPPAYLSEKRDHTAIPPNGWTAFVGLVFHRRNGVYAPLARSNRAGDRVSLSAGGLAREETRQSNCTTTKR